MPKVKASQEKNCESTRSNNTNAKRPLDADLFAMGWMSSL
jgi:hypothetical protein